jgi:hypothetical protein
MVQISVYKQSNDPKKPNQSLEGTQPMSTDCTYTSPNQKPTVSGPREQDRSAVTLKKLFKEYARENPGIVAAFCLGIGFALGWKLKLW